MNDFLELMKVSFLAAMPQTFAYILFAMSFLHPQPRQLYRRLACFAVFHSLYTDTLQIVFTLHLHFANSILAHALLLWFLFRDLSHKQKFSLFLFTNLFSMCIEVLNIFIAENIMGITDRNALLHDQFFRFLPVVYAEALILIVVSWFIRQRNLFALKRYFNLVVEISRGNIGKAAVLIVLQFVLFGVLSITNFARGEKYLIYTSPIIVYLLIAVSLTVLVLFVKLLIQSRQQAIKSAQDLYVEDINRMFTSIRGQRHDFINHLQVIHSLTQMGKTGDLQRYVRDLVQETQEMSEIVNHNSPALAAFVQAKTAVAVTKGIAFSCELPKRREGDDNSIRTIDMIKILGNLVDNAFDEVILLPADCRFVHASVQYEDGKIVMEVTNRGKALSPEEREKILTPGYTTKKDGIHSGLGLAIVAERTKHYGGTLDIRSNEMQGTTFRITLPLNKANAL